MATSKRRRFRAADEIADLKGLQDLIDHVTDLASSDEDVEPLDLSTATKSRAIIRSGSNLLPAVYQPEFLDGLKDLLKTYTYSSLLSSLDRDGEGPWRDWHSAIQQRNLDERRVETHAFMEVIRDLFDGFLSLEQRLGVKPPDRQQIAPLVKWGDPEAGPYTWPTHWYDLGIRTSIVSMPPAYSRNVALWAALGHETTGHDILAADDGLLAELTDTVRFAILDSDLTGTVRHLGQPQPAKEFLADYWARIIDETASDICGLLNLGPAAAVGLAVLFIPFGGGSLSRWTTADDPHPIDLSRMWLASELVQGLQFLDNDRKAAWVAAINGIADKWGQDGKLELRRSLFGSWKTETRIPREEFRKSCGIVARAIAFEKLATLEERSLADINTWTTIDEALTEAVAQDLTAGRPVDLKAAAEATTYAAHVLSGGVLAMCAKNADIDAVYEATIAALSGLYDQNPTWGGMPVVLPRDAVRHTLLPPDRKPALVDRKPQPGSQRAALPRKGATRRRVGSRKAGHRKRAQKVERKR